ncbi:SlyX family protein [Lichenibacterium minor]|uniref:Protein SlyX homolog n=1 Tax=Lichenibacterium minor TaxID=2316528 RepID=A0A4Q2UA04_9HYPH|nr:SlyX family protein [Lichenibacterium minor]RYC33410.1 SlyX family protein [Lichenibacterium minor]
MSRDTEARDADRLDRLEMRFAEQERVIEDLDAAVTAQWTVIEGLRRHVDRLLDRLADAERRLPAEPDAPPPHY